MLLLHTCGVVGNPQRGRARMRCFLFLLPLLLSVLATYALAEAPADDDLIVEEEIPDAANPTDQFNPEAFAKLMSTLSNKCQKEVQENPSDPTLLSDRCKSEIQRKVARMMEREKKAKEGGDDSKKQKKSKKTGGKKAGGKKKGKKKGKKSKAYASTKSGNDTEDAHSDVLTTIMAFVVTAVGIVVAAIVFINKRLKAAGMYYPADPQAPAGGCCG